MSRMTFRENGEEHNFWQNYTDLMSGFLIVFIITSLVAYGGYKKIDETLRDSGFSADSISSLINKVEQYRGYADIFIEQGISADSVSGILSNAKKYAVLRDSLRRNGIPADSISLGNILKLYEAYVDIYGKPDSISQTNLDKFFINTDLFKKIEEFYEAQKSINREYFKYNEEYQRFECAVDVLFSPESPVIPAQSYQQLIEAGKEIETIIEKYKESTNISFKVVIEGRAAKRHDTTPSASQKAYAARLSYERARNLYLFWKDRGVLQNIENQNGEVFISGSGFEGRGRYAGYGSDGEDRNKTFIIQIIPYIIFK